LVFEELDSEIVGGSALRENLDHERRPANLSHFIIGEVRRVASNHEIARALVVGCVR
jgi:hypothetical protein